MQPHGLLQGVGRGNLGPLVMARIPIGVDLLEAMEALVKKEGIQKALVLMGIGALKKAIFRNLKIFPESYPIAPRDRLYYEVEGPLEITSLTGYVVPKGDGSPLLHVHFSASTVREEKVVVYGGHLGPGAVTFVKVTVVLATLQDMPMGKKWIQERQTEDLWVGSPD